MRVGTLNSAADCATRQPARASRDALDSSNPNNACRSADHAAAPMAMKSLSAGCAHAPAARAEAGLEGFVMAGVPGRHGRRCRGAPRRHRRQVLLDHDGPVALRTITRQVVDAEGAVADDTEDFVVVPMQPRADGQRARGRGRGGRVSGPCVARGVHCGASAGVRRPNMPQPCMESTTSPRWFRVSHLDCTSPTLARLAIGRASIVVSRTLSTSSG